ncbi:MAG TPA: hypothetical protein VEB86_15495 [Chryseosolibacter sp.]|nr:hypothetical protein [Chryseosolibacter sp.]
MKIRRILALLFTAAIPFLYSACDDEEPKPAVVGFEFTEEEVTESNGELNSFHPLMVNGATGREHSVKLLLDKPVSENSVIQFGVAGSATRNSAAQLGDYSIEGSTVTIEKGQSEVIIPVTLYEDADFELNDDNTAFETIEITLQSVVSGSVKLGEQLTYVLKVNEDDAVWVLEWGINDTENPGDVDMDIFFTLDNEIIWYSDAVEEFEILNIPAAFPGGAYGACYTYYSGTSDDVDFVVGIYSTAGTLNGASYTIEEGPLTFGGHYTLANLNKYDDEVEGTDPIVVQTMTKTGINYTSISEIQEAEAGSRRAFPSHIKLDKKLLSKMKSLQLKKKNN